MYKHNVAIAPGFMRSCDSMLQAGWPQNFGSIFLFPNHPDCLWGPSRFLHIGYQGHFPLG